MAVARRSTLSVKFTIAALIVCSLVIGATGRLAWAASRADVPYGPAGAENMLDVRYEPGQVRPLIVFIHGGGWRRGNKRAGTKALAPFSSGYAYASINYRLAPQASLKDAATDVATAVAYLQKHASEFSADPKRIVLMGHSAGAHLAALVAVDPSYFAAAGVAPNTIRAVVLLDCGGCDIESDVARFRNAEMYKAIFGATREARAAYSPTSLATKTRSTPPFMITYAPDRPRSVDNAKPLADALAPYCGSCVLKPYSKDHMSFLRDLAIADDPLTKDVMMFLAEQLKS